MSDLSRVPTFAEIVDQSVNLLRRNLRGYYLPYAIAIAVFMAVQSAVQLGWMQSVFDVDPADPDAVMAAFLSPGLGCMIAVSWIVMMIVYSALGVASVNLVAERPVHRGALRFVVRPRTLGTLVLTGLALVASFMCCFFPAIYVFPALALVIPVMVEEQSFGTRALASSHELARYNPQGKFTGTAMVRILGVYLVSMLITWGLSFVITLPAMIIQQVMFFRQVAESSESEIPMVMPAMWLQVPTQFLSGLVQTAGTAFASIAVALIYFDVRRRRDAVDLEHAIDALEQPA